MKQALATEARSRLPILLTGLALSGAVLMALGMPSEIGDPASSALAVILAGVGLWCWEVVHNAKADAAA